MRIAESYPPEAVPAVKLLNSIIRAGIEAGASEILLEAGADRGLVQFRVDGTLREHMQVPPEVTPFLLRRMAVLSRLYPIKPAERQEGTARVRINAKAYELGVTLLPSPAGHRLSLRVLQLPETE